MDNASIDLVIGIIKCALGLVLIFLGIIGWPATRRIFGCLAFFFAGRAPHKPVGSKLWSKVDKPDQTKKRTFFEENTKTLTG